MKLNYTVTLKRKKQIFSVLAFLLILVALQQVEFPFSGFLTYLDVFHSPYLLNAFGISAPLVLIWGFLISYFFTFKTNKLKERKTNLSIIIIPLIIITEICCISTFFSYNPEGLLKESYGGFYGELLIKYPSSWDRFNPSFINYFIGAVRIITISFIFVVLIAPIKTLMVLKRYFLNIFKYLKTKKLGIKKTEPVMEIESDREDNSSFLENQSLLRHNVQIISDSSEFQSRTFEEKSNEVTKWTLPNENLLHSFVPMTQSQEEINKKKNLIIKTLREHGIEVSVDQVKSGPSVTMYGLLPGYGDSKRVRVDHILAREKDLALALASPNIRFQSPVPGESLVGIEIPNEKVTSVSLKTLINKKAIRHLKDYDLPIALGIASDNKPVYCDLTKLPHLLVAGATGSGKSVCINSIITGFLMQKTPDELRFVMIDPKRVELTPYGGIPHLLTDPIVEPSEAIKALRLMIEEMSVRFKLLEGNNVKNISGYNQRVSQKMPHIVIIVDELADLMLRTSSEFEKLLVRLAQLGRATGIHLIVATQRPSVDVVTGLIKANFPSRISFSVTSQIDSRTIIDSPGAEKLIGKGDMLFAPVDNPQAIRAQGIFISDEEIEKLVMHWKSHSINTPLKMLDLESLVDLIIDVEESSAIIQDDDLASQAIELARGQRTLSTSFLQRRLGIGYPRAARLMDRLEELGVVRTGEPGKPKEVV